MGGVLEIKTSSRKEKEKALDREKLSCNAVSVEVSFKEDRTRDGLAESAPSWKMGPGLYTLHRPVTGCGLLWEGA